MNMVCSINMCAGCMLCADVCPQQAITIHKSVAAYSAIIDTNKCCNCGLCHKICQINFQPQFREPIFSTQGWAKDENIRYRSSSGGFATALEISFILNGGIVYSCTYKDGEFCFASASTVEEVSKFAGSKYVKSNPSGVYKEIRYQVRKGRRVLFVGLPCQVAAVLNYCGESENLYTVDLICHGTPSPDLLFMYLKDNRISKEDVHSISFRSKTRFRLDSNEISITYPRILDFYTDAFLKGTTYTENCYSCKYARIERVSDITLGDSWGSELSKEEQLKGISLALVQSQKGMMLIESAELCLKNVSIETAVNNNHQLKHPSIMNADRKVFFSEIKKGNSFSLAYRRTFPKQYFKDKIKLLMIKLHLLGGGVNNFIQYGLKVEKFSERENS